jgi:hypothetical protein
MTNHKTGTREKWLIFGQYDSIYFGFRTWL